MSQHDTEDRDGAARDGAGRDNGAKDSTATAAPAAPPARTWPQILEHLLHGEDLSADTASWAMSQLMSGELTDVEIAGFLTALRAKGETAEELLGLSTSMLDHAVPVRISSPSLDIVGTGGDGLGTVNISTMSSLIAAGAGARIVKHGNRGASTTAGAADVIEALGVDLAMSTQRVAQCAEQTGITFLFAQQFHPSMRHVAPVRRGLGVRTVFNFLGPLSNPAGVTAQALGCAHERLTPEMARVMALRGIHGLVFRGRDGRDKITTSAETDIWEVRHGEVQHYVIAPEDFGLDRVRVDSLRGGDGAHNADIVRGVLDGRGGPVREAALLNAAAGLTAWSAAHAAMAPRPDGTQSERTVAGGIGAELADDLPQRLQANLQLAQDSVDSGAAAAVLDRWVEFSRR